MAVDWYIRPMAAGLLRKNPLLGAIFYAVRTDSSGYCIGGFFGSHQVDATFSTTLSLEEPARAVQSRLFGPDSALEPYSRAVAFRPCSRWDGDWSPLVALRRHGDGLKLEGLATLHRREEVWDAGPTLRGRTIDQSLDDLQLIDATAMLLWRMEQVVEAVEATRIHPGERESLAWAVRYLEWTLGIGEYTDRNDI
jgi:hypothetical protein